MRAISLFSGVGGFELGLERAGIQTILQAEADPWCLSVLARHWPEVERVSDVSHVTRELAQQLQSDHGSGDADSGAVREGGRSRPRDGALGVSVGGTDAERLRRERESNAGIDLVYGGFPCQDLSVAGKRAGFGGARSSLWFEFHRVLSELRPRWCLIENVPGLLSSASGHDFGTLLGGLDELGFAVAWAVLDAQHFGVPQRRRRVFIVGGPDRRACEAVLALCEGCSGDFAPSREAREGVAYSLAASVRGTGDGHGNAWNSNYVAGTLGANHGNVKAEHAWTDQFVMAPLTANMVKGPGFSGGDDRVIAAPLTAGGHPNSHEPGRHREDDENLVAFDWQSGGDIRLNVAERPMLQANQVPALSGHFGVRRLTPLECERLMGWPDDHTRWTADGREVADSQRYRMCGNGVVATVAEWIGWRLMAVSQ